MRIYFEVRIRVHIQAVRNVRTYFPGAVRSPDQVLFVRVKSVPRAGSLKSLWESEPDKLLMQCDRRPLEGHISVGEDPRLYLRKC